MNLLSLFERKFYVPLKTTINGNVNSAVNAVIAGTIVGDVKIEADLIILKNGTIQGTVRANNVVVKGKVFGDIHCEGKVNIHANAEVQGNIFATESIIDKGSVVIGKISQLHTAEANLIITQPPEHFKTSAETTNIKVQKSNQSSDSSAESWF